MQSQYVSVYGLDINTHIYVPDTVTYTPCKQFQERPTPKPIVLNNKAANSPEFEPKARQFTLLDNVLVVVGLCVREPIATQSKSNTGIDSAINVARIYVELCLQIVGLRAVAKHKIGAWVGVSVAIRGGNGIQQRWRRRPCHGAFHNHRHPNCRVNGGSSPNKVRKQSTLELEIENQFKFSANRCLMTFATAATDGN